MRLVRAMLAGAGCTAVAISPAIAQQSPTAVQPDIVVTGNRLPGSADGPIAPEVSLDAQAIEAIGASTLADLVSQLSAQTGGAQSRAGDTPILLLNGKRISSFGEVRDLPPESVRRVDILPEEAAIRYGFPAHQKLINIVLLGKFQAVTGELEPRYSPGTGRGDFNTELNAVRIDGDNRMTLDLQYQIGGSILESERGIGRGSGLGTASYAGIVRVDGSAESISPALDSLVGVKVKQLTLPAATPLSVADFARAAALPVADDSAGVRTLVPRTQQFTVNGVFARTLGKGISLTANARFDQLVSDALLGPAEVSLTAPGTSSFSPFGSPVRVDRYLAGAPPLGRRTRVDTTHLGTILAGTLARWTWSVTTNYDHALTHIDTRGGVDPSDFAALVTAGSANPFAALDPAAFLARAPRGTRGAIDTLAADVVASGSLVALPAGDATLSLRASSAIERSFALDTAGARTRLGRDLAGGQAAIDLPITSRFSPIGSLALGASAFLRDYSDAGTIIDRGWTVSWTPRPFVSVLVAGNSEGAVATTAQRGDAVNITPGAAYFDFGTAQTIAANQINGGVADLRADRRNLFKAEVTIKPILNTSLTITYSDLQADNPIIAFPGVTPAFEAAFPSRIVRGADGLIATIDARPINFASEQRRELRWGLNFSRNFGAKDGGPRVPGGGSFGGGHYFGARGSTLQAAIYHSWRFADAVVLAPETTSIDLLGSNRLGDTLIVPRHVIDAQLSATYAGFGLRSTISWASESDIGVGTPGRLHVAPPVTFNLRLFAFPARLQGLVARMPWLKGVRFLAAFDNIFDTFSRVTGQQGTVPLAYQRGYRDALGRTIRLSIRKTF